MVASLTLASIVGGLSDAVVASGGAQASDRAATDTLVVIYAGETRANLVACSCPDHPWGGLARRVGFFRDARLRHPGSLTLAFDTGGFLPSGDVPLRDTPSAARTLTGLLLDSFDRASIDAFALDRGEARFLHGLAPSKISQWQGQALDADPPDPAKWWDWGSRRVGVIALASTLSDSAVIAASSSVRGEADVMIVIARADALDGRRIARLSEADLVLLSRAARPPQPLREGRTWMVGAGGNGREVGEVILAWTKGRVELVDSRLHPMDDTVVPDPLVDEQVRLLLDEEGPGWQALLHDNP